jgi:Family of unknown function (DUF6152)
MRSMVASLLLALSPGLAFAHHGWSWTTGENVEVTGVIREADLGMPHGVLMLDVDGEAWTVEVGQPWRNERAGLADGDLAPGVEVRIEGEPSADISERRVKAERLWIGDRAYELYPDRD